MGKHRAWVLPSRAPHYLAQLEQIREQRGMTTDDAAKRMGLDRTGWTKLTRAITRKSRIEGDDEGRTVIRPSFDSIAAMADAMSHTLVLVPLYARPPKQAHAPAVTTIVARPRVAGPVDPTPASAEFMRNLWDIRKGKGIRHDTLAQRTGLTEHRISGMENGKREPMLCEVVDYADGLDMEIVAVPRGLAGLAFLTEKEGDEVKALVTAYVQHRIGKGLPVPNALLMAAGKLDMEQVEAA